MLRAKARAIVSFRSVKLSKVLGILLGVALAGPCGAQAPKQGDELRLVIVLTRHGVRTPLLTGEKLAALSSQPWPKWEADPGIQTPHGNLLVSLMGDYYRTRFTTLGLLSGDPAQDGAAVYVRADNDQRTFETARILGKALVPQVDPEVHALDAGLPDPLFRPVQAHVGHPSRELAASAVLGRIGGDPSALERAYALQLGELKTVLYGAGGRPPEGSPFDQPISVAPGRGAYLVDFGGPLQGSLNATDALLLEYADGKPDPEVGWGRLDTKTLTDLLTLHQLFFDLSDRTFYLAQVSGSNLVAHVIDTLEQAALGLPVPGAVGPPEEKVVILAGHDSNIANVGGLLGLNWIIPGSQANPALPGGALVFELWRRTSGESQTYFVRASYVCQTLEQMRQATPLSIDRPPARAPIFIPGASGQGPTFDAPLNALLRQARKVIDPEFTTLEP